MTLELLALALQVSNPQSIEEQVTIRNSVVGVILRMRNQDASVEISPFLCDFSGAHTQEQSRPPAPAHGVRASETNGKSFLSLRRSVAIIYSTLKVAETDPWRPRPWIPEVIVYSDALFSLAQASTSRLTPLKAPTMTTSSTRKFCAGD